MPLNTLSGVDVHLHEHVKWVQNNAFQSRVLTDPEAVLVIVLCTALRTGPWNVSGWRTRLRPFGVGARMSTRADLATFDVSGLTRLVFLAHDWKARVALSPAGFGGIEIQLHLREKRESAEIWERHPTLEAVVADWRQNHGEER